MAEPGAGPAARPPARRWLRAVRRTAILPAILLIRGYQSGISRFTPRTCRFQPTCSRYALRALAWHGPFKGAWLSARRILRCHPFGPEDPWDPVPRPRRSRHRRAAGRPSRDGGEPQPPSDAPRPRSASGR